MLPVLLRTLDRVGNAAHRYIVTGRLRSSPGPIIDRFFGGKDCFFVQVGSYDGIAGDSLHSLIVANPRWRGIFIEPLDEAFNRLVANYPADARLAFENVAISDLNGEQWLHYVSLETIRETKLDDIVQSLSSLNRDHLLTKLTKCSIKGPESCISSKLVRCETLQSVLTRHNVSRIDVFNVDAESYDYQIIRQIDFQRYCPKLILFEHRNLTNEERDATQSLLLGKGYQLVNCGLLDTMAVRSR